MKIKITSKQGIATMKKIKSSHIIAIILSLCYICYISISDIYPFLPPLIGLLFVIFHKNYSLNNIFILVCILCCIVFFELYKLLIVGILPLLFFIMHLFIMRQFNDVLVENIMFVAIEILLMYIIYFVVISAYIAGSDSHFNVNISFVIFSFFIDVVLSMLYTKIICKKMSKSYE